MVRCLCRLLLACCGLLTGAAAKAGAAHVSLHYDLSVKLEPAMHRMAVSGEVLVPAGTAGHGQLTFAITGASGPVRWSSADPASRIHAAASASSRNAAASNAAERAGKTEWNVRGDWARSAPVRLRFAYDIVTAEPDGFLYVGKEISFAAGGWYPEIARSGATATFRIETPAGWSPVSPGRLVAARATAGARASARFVSAVPGELFFAASPPGARPIAISGELGFARLKVRPTDAGWRAGLIAMKRALEEEFGHLPYGNVTVIEVPDGIAAKAGFGAFAAPGAVLARSQLVEQPFNVAAFAHEFSHLWWGNSVQLEGKEGDFLLDEGLAQYGSMVAADRVLGRAAGASYRRRGVPGFNESLYSALGYLKINAAGLDRPLLGLGDDGLSYWIAYSKAGLAWYALAEYMGRADFRAALKRIGRDHAGGFVSWRGFVSALQGQSSRRLQPFIAQWFGRAGAPSYTLGWRIAGHDVHGTLTTGDARKAAALELEVRFFDGSVRRRRIAVQAAGSTFSFPVASPVREIVVDPDYKVLRWTAELRAEAVAMAPYMRALVLARTGRAPAAEAELRQWLSEDPRSNAYDRLILSHARLAGLADARKCPQCALDEIAAALQTGPEGLAQLVPTYIELASLARKLGRRDLAERAADLAISGDAMAGNANGAAAKLGWQDLDSVK